MEYRDAVSRLAPCGLDCSRCADYAGGKIQELSAQLAERLNGYLRISKVRKEINPVYSGYPQFEEVLKIFAQAACSGCRGDNVLCPIECAAGRCTREKGIDFCFQCEDFPCTKHIDSQTRDRWLKFNQRMKEIGVVEYYLEQSKLPRY